MKNINDTNNTITAYSKVLRIMAIVCFAIIAVYVIAGFTLSPELKLFYESARVYDEDWIKEELDGSTKSLRMPMSMHLDDEETISIYTMLPDNVESGMYLAVNTGKSFTMYIDGKAIYTFNNKISRLPGNITKTIIIPVPLEDSYAGQKLTMTITNGKYDRNSINTAYIGSLMGIAMILIRSYALQFVMAMLLIIASLVTICIFAYNERRYNRKAPLIHLAQGILLICLWIIFDSPLFQMLFGAYFFDGVTGFMLVTTMGWPFLVYFDDISGNRRHKIFAICETIIIVNFVVLTFLHMAGIRSYDKSLVYVDVMLLIYIIVMIVSTLQDYFSQKDGNHRNVVIGLVGLSLFSFFEIVITIVNASIPFKVDIGGLFVLIGMIVLLIFATLDQVSAFEILKQETQNAIAATKAKSDFLANMSHEIRTPINAIMGMNEMILAESDQNSIRDYAKDINSASENLLRIVNDILDFSKIESGKLEIVNDNYDLGEVIYDVVTLVNMKAENKGLRLRVIVDENLPSKLYGDDKRVREIITNLLNNAVKYTERGFVKLKIDGEMHEKIVKLNIHVEDSGQGIKKEDLDSIFDGFSQVNVKKNKHIEGTGLGLSITKRLVELMDGAISVQSEFGRGSKFLVVLPQQIVADEKMGDYKTHRHASADPINSQPQEIDFSGKNILVVDDTELNLKVICKFLAKSGAELTCASSGEEMLKLIVENTYDIILLDHMMPDMDGIETLKVSKGLSNNKCAKTPVIVLTANAIVGAKDMYIEAGFDDYLSKPVKMEELYGMIAKYIDNN